MVAKKKARSAKKNGRAKARNPAVSAALARMDQGAVAYRRLLLDPCNAPICAPVYAGLGSGIYRRYRTYIDIGASNVEGAYVFQFSTNTHFHAGHVAATAGSVYTYGSSLRTHNAPELTESHYSGSRCLAGCVKVRYRGSESDRAGLVGLATMATAHKRPGITSNASLDLSLVSVVSRVGEVLHEVKFAPGAHEEEFTLHQTTSAAFDDARGCIMIVYKGIPPGSLVLEVTSVHELESTSSCPYSAVPPPSSTTLNTVLRSMGPIVNWAYSNASAPVMRAFAGGAVRTMTRFAGASAATVPLITL